MSSIASVEYTANAPSYKTTVINFGRDNARTRLLELGEGSLSEVELLSLLLPCGPRNVRDVAEELLIRFGSLRTLLTAARAQAGRGGKMVLVAPNDMVRKTLEIAGVDRIVPIVQDWESAQANLRA